CELRRKLGAPDVLLEGLADVHGAGDELPGPHRAAVLQRDAGRLAALDDDAVKLDLRRKAPAGRDESLGQRAGEVGRAALAELVAALEVKGADQRAHRAGLRQ